MKRILLPLFSIVLCASAFASTGAAASAPPHHRASPPASKIAKRPVTFRVTNVNRSALACASDGAEYDVKGHLVGPSGQLAAGSPSPLPAVTLYLHGFSFGEFFWSFSALPRYDHAAALARAGRISLVIDRLGYGSSGRPGGNATCLGAQADIAHQIVGDLRTGDYAIEGGGPPRFEHVALTGHSTGALIANLEAFSFQDVDALVAISYTPQVTIDAFEQFYASRSVCDAGGEPAAGGAPGGYVSFAKSEADFRKGVFASADPSVADAVTRLRTRDPCGDGGSIIDALVLELKSLSRVTAPVLVVCGKEDRTTPYFACPYLKRRYVGSKDVSLAFIPHAGHALPFERQAPTFRRKVSAWLSARGF